MDNELKDKIRIAGALTVLVIAVFSVFFLFYQQKEKKNTAMRLRLFYSDMSQTLQYSISFNGLPGDWDWYAGYKNADLINNYLAKYLHVSENCVKTVGACFPDIQYKNLKRDDTSVSLNKLPSLKLKNGISVAFETISSCKQNNKVCALVYVDINGAKNPNMFGKDLFIFTIRNSQAASFTPFNMSVNYKNLLSDEKLGCNKTALIPMYCSGLLYSTNWSIDSKYPW